MLVTITNTTADPIFLNFAYRELGATGTATDSLTLSRSHAELSTYQDFMVKVENGDSWAWRFIQNTPRIACSTSTCPMQWEHR